MDKQALTQMWDQFRQKYGVYLRLLETFPEDHFQSRPVPPMRTPAELVVHMSGNVVRDIAQGVARGEITSDESTEGRIAAGLDSREAVLSLARECWNLADEAVAGIGDAELAAMVPTPWDMTFPGWAGFYLMNDEFVHHRGQLHVFARIFGVAPPFIWGFEDNEPGFRPAE